MSAAEQLNLADYAQEVEQERARVQEADRARRRRRAFVVFATHPDRVGEDDYKLVFACEAQTRSEAEQRVRGHVEPERRVLAYLASGKYGALLPQARWVS